MDLTFISPGNRRFNYFPELPNFKAGIFSPYMGLFIRLKTVAVVFIVVVGVGHWPIFCFS